IRNKLPKEIDEPIILRVNLSDQAVIQVGLEANLPPAQLYDLANEELKNRFAQIPGVGKVDLVGGRKREIEVLLDRNLLKDAALSATRVTGRIADSSSNVPVGKVTKDDMDLNFRTLGEYRGVQQIEDAVVSFTDRPVRVRDVGTVVDSLEDAKSLAYVDGRPAIVFNVYKQTGTNTVKVVDGVQALLAKMNAEIKDRPGSPRLSPLQDGSVWIRQNVEDVQETIAIGVLLVIVVVYFFLGNFRSTFITALALPNSLIGAFLLMHLAGFTINIMTLLALSLSVGLLIDDAIVVRENIFRHIEHGESPWKAALLGTREVNLAVIATSSVVIAVFLPVGFLSGTVGKFLGQFGLTMCFAMAISLFDAITIAPMLSAFFAGTGEQKRASLGSFTWGGAVVGGFAVGVVGLVVAHTPVGRGIAVLAGALLGGLAPGFVQAFEIFQERLEHLYGRIIRWVVDHRGRTVLL
ncbi:MAG TPA: efflux RND transporter permease subunit, partial [bacterium]|nr:efflux RND transporter permease subunit [bacterium]